MTLSEILLAYALCVLGVGIACYLYNLMRDKALHWELSRPRLCRCAACNRVFMVKRFALVPRCPRCKGVSNAFVQS